jgi:hypothetical protein
MAHNLLIVACLLVGIGPVMGQDRNYSITFTGAQLDYMFSLLKRQPWEDAAALISVLQTQVSQQNQAAQNAATESLRKQIEQEAKEKRSDGPAPPNK